MNRNMSHVRAVLAEVERIEADCAAKRKRLAILRDEEAALDDTHANYLNVGDELLAEVVAVDLAAVRAEIMVVAAELMACESPF